ncbi:MAG: hypothetical protein HY704_10805 [Gemmatimonadetes bacterium]|nr:hypothetical protein [Gemmatimonadota bacterium]
MPSSDTGSRRAERVQFRARSAEATAMRLAAAVEQIRLDATDGKPVPYEQARAWLLEAEKIAGLQRTDGWSWDAYRRLWASARKDLPDADVAQARGWAILEALRLAYQRPDDATMLRVVTHRAELRRVG